jgi:Trk-type K+ transport system membrane component
MDATLLKDLGAVAGLGGLSIGVVMAIFREVIRKNIFPKLNARDAYRTIRLIVTLTFSVAVIGIAAWAYVEVQASGKSAAQTTSGANSPIISGVTGNVTTNSGTREPTQ